MRLPLILEISMQIEKKLIFFAQSLILELIFLLIHRTCREQPQILPALVRNKL